MRRGDLSLLVDMIGPAQGLTVHWVAVPYVAVVSLGNILIMQILLVRIGLVVAEEC